MRIDQTPGPDSESDAQRAALTDGLMTAAALLYFRMRLAAQELLEEGELSAGRRSLLRDVARNGPQTVPQLARKRSVSRQHIQTVVNALMADGLAERVVNPAHKGSPLVRPTPAGARAVRELARREAALFPQLTAGISLKDLETATTVLDQLRSTLEGGEWGEAIDDRDASI